MASILGENGLDLAGNGSGGNGGADLIADSNAANFAAQVIEKSMEVPVLVDFWAPWCEPCKTLTPILEKLVREYSGAVRLVKINVDENKDLAQELRVQSIPVVFAFKSGRAVDALQGAQPESQIRRFIERLTGNTGSPVGQALEEAKGLLDGGDSAEAGEIYGQVLAAEADNAVANAGMARCLMAGGDNQKAQQFLDRLAPELRSQADVAAVQTALDLAAPTIDRGAADELAERVAQNPADHQARFDLALSLYGGGQPAAAIEQLVEIVRRERKWNDEAARLQILKIFEALGNSDPVTVEGRRKLSAVLFS